MYIGEKRRSTIGVTALTILAIGRVGTRRGRITVQNKTRVTNWSVNLGLLAEEVVGAEFKWGVTDCVTMLRRALEAMYGEDIAAPYIDVAYTTKTGATRAYNKMGGYEGIIEKVGCKEIPARLAKDGDFALFKREHGYDNVVTKMGGSWIIADPDINKIIPVNIHYETLDKEAKVFRIV
jgi:hypothetical protein